MNFLGMDPDKKGAISLITPDYKIIELIDMPIINTGRTGAMRIGYDEDRISHLIEEFALSYSPIYAVLEEPIVWGRNSRGENGEEGGKKYGDSNQIWMGYGIIRGILASKGIRRQMVLPSVWKPRVGVPKGSDKTGSITIAKQLFPQTVVEKTFIKPRGWKETLHGRADALLLAVYGMRVHGIAA